ncbi:hypothetical protein NVP1170O_108 [Vibrio phage 1.170.O._10N.261.52.C3]|nr:hypothetical protein NVP1170O_108 [Vibrio phage 1.170.O._10N.261.52.C3]
MVEFIVINTSDYRKNCFDFIGCDNSRWQIDFYSKNLYYDKSDPCDDEFLIGTLHFTAYNLKYNTARDAYNYLLNTLKILVESYRLDQKESSNINEPYSAFTLSDCYEENLTGCLSFYNKLFDRDHNFNSNSIKDLNRLVYQYYSALKWLSYGFGDSNTPCFEDREDFEMFLYGNIKLMDLPPNSIW